MLFGARGASRCGQDLRNMPRGSKSSTGSGFDILVDGKPRTFRDVRQTAIEAGIVFKRERPQSEVTVRDVRNNSITLIDGDLITAFEVSRKR
jgi:hypothetical protein